MIVKGMLVLTLGGMLTGATDLDLRNHSASTRFKQTAALSRSIPATVGAHRRAPELQRLEEAVRQLGGKAHHARILLSAGREFRIDPVFLAAVAHVESSFRPRVSSKLGARGLMQLRPTVIHVLGVIDPWDPQENIMAGAAYLLHCFERYAKHPNSTYLALAAYNIGPGPVEKLTRSDPAKRFVHKVLTAYNSVAEDQIPVKRAETGMHRKSARSSSGQQARHRPPAAQ